MNVQPISDASIKEAIAILHDGGVIAHATETCYGLACDLSNAKAVEKLFAIKNRPSKQPVSALFSSIDQAQQYLEWNEGALLLATQHLPGPLTIILTKKPECQLHVCPEGSETVGVRISSHPTARQLAEMFGSPLSTTSANIHGKKSPYSLDEMMDQYKAASVLPDLILDDGQLDHTATSTVIDASHGDMEIRREGGIAI